MALIAQLRTYFASAFTGKYYEQAEAAFEALQTMVSDPHAKFTPESLPFPGDEGEDTVDVSGLRVSHAAFIQKFPKLHVVFTDRKALMKTRGAQAALLDYYTDVLRVFKRSEAFVLFIGLTTGGAPLTPQLIQSQMKSSRVLKHLFVHEYVHYVQLNRFAAILLPLSQLSDSTPYHQRWEEIEAWNVETFSRFLATVPKAVKLEIVNDINRFELAFIKFILDRHKSGAGFYTGMTQLERGRFIRESFDLLRKKMAATTKGT